MSKFYKLAVLLITVSTLAGCGKSQSPLETSISSATLPQPTISDNFQSNANNLSADTGRITWGIWNISIPADRSTVEIVPDRSSNMHLNLVRMLEVNPCEDCLSVEIEPQSNNVINAALTLEHPINYNHKLTGFDVRGIFISPSNYVFPTDGRSLAWGEGITHVSNPDGYTQLYNPTEFNFATPAALGYISGNLATGGDLTATLNPYVAYAADQPRRFFGPGMSKTETVELYVPSGPVQFGYAVDACWHPVPGEVTNPLTDFPPEANCLEAYMIVTVLDDGLAPAMGSEVPIYVAVFDHQGQETINSVTVECPELFDGTVELEYADGSSNDGFIYTGTIINQHGADYGDYPLLVKVTDVLQDINLGQIAAWNVFKVPIRYGWGRTWGGVLSDAAYAVDVDGSGNAYVTGTFRGTADFDPGPLEDNMAAAQGSDAFLCKFNPAGVRQWTITWGGGGEDRAYGIAVDNPGNSYVCGFFSETVDFDPGDGVQEEEAVWETDVYLVKYNKEGEFEWVRTWGGPKSESAYDAAVDQSGFVSVTGSFKGMVDFIPGPATENHISEGGSDIFLCRYDHTGVFQWARTFGSSQMDGGFGVECDATGSIAMTGCFSETVDFDIGPGLSVQESNGNEDVFLARFDTTGNLFWSQGWGGTDTDIGRAVTLEAGGTAFVTGTFNGGLLNKVDFDPGPGQVFMGSNGQEDVFVSGFSPSGTYIQAATWGGSGIDASYGIASDGSGNICITGGFNATVDFNPGTGIDYRSSSGPDSDAYLVKLDSSGNYVWARTWGYAGIEPIGDEGRGVAINNAGDSFVAGIFYGTIDYEPGPSIDERTSHGETDAFLVKFTPDGEW